MTRNILESPKEEPKITVFNSNYCKNEYLIHVITPIFGGGVEPNENDLDMIIRPSSIRGHLRFWWRATFGAKFDTAKNLFNREGEVWGTTNSPSPVTIQISQPGASSLKQRDASNYYGFQNKYGPESYVLFPAREKKASICKEGFKFQLKVTWPTHKALQHLRDKENAALRQAGKRPIADKIDDISPDVEEAIWAWANFGGIGARTRRGCGALFCKETGPSSIDDIGKWYKNHFERFGIEQQTHLAWPKREWPTLPQAIMIGHTWGDPVVEWGRAIEIMSSFRQGVGIGRNPGESKFPGRSLWPEPETIRKLVGSRLPKHKLQPHMPDSFPRAELGLPILFHFKDGQDPPPQSLNKNREPFPTELCPVGAKRMASPIILRPMAFDDGTKAVRLIIRLNTGQLTDVELKVGGNVIGTFGPSGIRNPNLAKYPGSPLVGRTSNYSALEAFVAYAMANKFKEVGL